ncbi:hypothetical protein [Plasmodium yoelii yoelii]|uniref:Uncharacterized protein n=1 Tax=Plasmodium yoelii yoelii TaxID=73239 RepID=Q7RSI7_PLAYO|nr:hypothetical protein [Plasmodium yoelii yoelii]
MEQIINQNSIII